MEQADVFIIGVVEQMIPDVWRAPGCLHAEGLLVTQDNFAILTPLNLVQALTQDQRHFVEAF